LAAFTAEAGRWPHLRDTWGRSIGAEEHLGWDWDWIWHESEVSPDTSDSKRDSLDPVISPRSQPPYLTLARPLRRTVRRSHAEPLPFPDESLWDEEEDVIAGDELTMPPMPATRSGNHTQEWHIHILYSSTWHVPVLYFNARHVDGRPATWEEVRALLPTSLDEAEGECSSLWPYVTQEAHPATGEPCFMLHPCQTAACVGEMLAGGGARGAHGSREAVSGKSSTSASSTSSGGGGGGGGGDCCGDGATVPYLLCWFSMVAPAVGLSVPPLFFRACCVAGFSE